MTRAHQLIMVHNGLDSLRKTVCYFLVNLFSYYNRHKKHDQHFNAFKVSCTCKIFYKRLIKKKNGKSEASDLKRTCEVFLSQFHLRTFKTLNGNETPFSLSCINY